jgi:hypothetical protein
MSEKEVTLFLTFFDTSKTERVWLFSLVFPQTSLTEIDMSHDDRKWN